MEVNKNSTVGTLMVYGSLRSGYYLAACSYNQTSSHATKIKLFVIKAPDGVAKLQSPTLQPYVTGAAI